MGNSNKSKKDSYLLNYIRILIIISFPVKIKCFDIEQCSSFIICVLFILFFLALLGNYSIKRKGYKKINDQIQLSTKL